VGENPVYSDAAVQTCLTMKVPFGMALRQTTGFVDGLLSLISLDWDVADYNTLGRRQKTLAANIPHRGPEGPPHLSIASTGKKDSGAKASGVIADQKTVRGTVFPPNAQSRQHKASRPAQDPHRNRRKTPVKSEQMATGRRMFAWLNIAACQYRRKMGQFPGVKLDGLVGSLPGLGARACHIADACQGTLAAGQHF